MAGWRLDVPPGLRGDSAGGGRARPYHDLAHAAADRSGDASRGLRVGDRIVGRHRFGEGSADRDRCPYLEANAQLRSIMRRDHGESYEEFLTGLAHQSGIATPTREDLARVDASSGFPSPCCQDVRNIPKVTCSLDFYHGLLATSRLLLIRLFQQTTIDCG